MPFEVPQVETPVETQRRPYMHYAEALMRGCGLSRPACGLLFDRENNRACALGAMALGFDTDPFAWEDTLGCRLVMRAYRERYGSSIIADNDNAIYTREQIAERIAAL